MPQTGGRALPCAALLLGALLSACAADGDGPLRFSRIEACFRVREASERVFTTAQEWSAFHALHGLGAPPAVDFNRSVVVARFDGTGSACTAFTVEGVALRDGRVEVSLTRHVSPDPCVLVIAYPQIVLEIERREAPVSFAIAEARDTRAAQPCL
jgi:hypothetical protein